MKTIRLLFTASLLSFFFVSCNQYDKVLVKKGGQWKKVSHTLNEYTNGVLDTTYSVILSREIYTFEDDGTGMLEYDGGTLDFTWTANDDESELTFVGDFLVATVEVRDFERDSQTWVEVDEVISGNDVLTFESVYELERVD